MFNACRGYVDALPRASRDSSGAIRPEPSLLEEPTGRGARRRSVARRTEDVSSVTALHGSQREGRPVRSRRVVGRSPAGAARTGAGAAPGSRRRGARAAILQRPGRRRRCLARSQSSTTHRPASRRRGATASSPRVGDSSPSRRPRGPRWGPGRRGRPASARSRCCAWPTPSRPTPTSWPRSSRPTPASRSPRLSRTSCPRPPTSCASSPGPRAASRARPPVSTSRATPRSCAARRSAWSPRSPPGTTR